MSVSRVSRKGLACAAIERRTPADGIFETSTLSRVAHASVRGRGVQRRVAWRTAWSRPRHSRERARGATYRASECAPRDGGVLSPVTPAACDVSVGSQYEPGRLRRSPSVRKRTPGGPSLRREARALARMTRGRCRRARPARGSLPPRRHRSGSGRKRPRRTPGRRACWAARARRSARDRGRRFHGRPARHHSRVPTVWPALRTRAGARRAPRTRGVPPVQNETRAARARRPAPQTVRARRRERAGPLQHSEAAISSASEPVISSASEAAISSASDDAAWSAAPTQTGARWPAVEASASPSHSRGTAWTRQVVLDGGLGRESRERFLRRRGIGDLPSDDGTFEVTGAGVHGLLLERLHVDVAGTEADAVTRLDETHPDEAFSVETHVPFAAHVLDRDAAPGAEQSQVARR
jgi:hypothetical protein